MVALHPVTFVSINCKINLCVLNTVMQVIKDIAGHQKRSVCKEMICKIQMNPGTFEFTMTGLNEAGKFWQFLTI